MDYSTGGALQPALSRAWLTIDNKANVASGTTPQLQPGKAIENRKVPTPDNPLPVQPVTVGPGGRVTRTPHSANEWPTFTQGQWKTSAVNRPYSDLVTSPIGITKPAGGKGTYADLNNYPGHDAHSQMTDSAGWNLYTSSGRTATRKRIGYNGDGFRAFWPIDQVLNPVRKLAKFAVANNSPAGTPGVLNGSQLPGFGTITVGGNTAYEAPNPPATTPPVSGSATSNSSGSWLKWQG